MNIGPTIFNPITNGRNRRFEIGDIRGGINLGPYGGTSIAPTVRPPAI